MFQNTFRSVFFRRILTVILFVSILSTLILGFASYGISSNQIKNQVQSSQKNLMKQLNTRISDQFSMMEQIIIKASFYPIFLQVLKSNNLNLDYHLVYELTDVITLLKNSHGLICDVVFYNASNGTIITDQNGYNKLSEEQKSFLSGKISGDSNFYYVDELDFSLINNGINNFNTVFVCDVNGSNGDAKLLVALSKRFIDGILEQLNIESQGSAFIIRQSGRLYKPQHQQNETIDKVIESDKFKKIVNEKNKNDLSLNDLNYQGKSYSVVFGAYPRISWIFTTVVPLSKLLEPVKRNITYILLALTGTLLLILLLSFIFSRRMYRPIHELTGFIGIKKPETDNRSRKTDEFKIIRDRFQEMNSEINEIAKYMEVNRSSLKEGFLMQLLQGNFTYYTEKEIVEGLKNVGIDLKDKKFILVFFRFFLTKGGKSKFDAGDDQLATYAAANIIEEMSEGMPQILGTVNYHNLSFALIMEIDGLEEQWKNSVSDFCNKVAETVHHFLDFKVYVSVSNIAENVKMIPYSFKEARECIKFRDVNRMTEVIFVQDTGAQNIKNLESIAKYEEDIINSIKLGLAAETSEKIVSFIDYLIKESGKEFYIQQCLLHLLGSILHTMQQIGAPANQDYLGDNIYEMFLKIKEPQAMKEWFKDILLDPYFNKMNSGIIQKYSSTINNIVEMLNKNYMEELSLDLCAEEAGIPPKRLSAIFYKFTGKNFIDYLTDIRIEKSKQLLSESDESVYNIAVKVGYQPSYFNRSFKRAVGMTPGEFRLAARKST